MYSPVRVTFAGTFKERHGWGREVFRNKWSKEMFKLELVEKLRRGKSLGFIE